MGEARDIYGGRQPRDLALYSLTEGARILRLRRSTLRTWVLGRSYPTAEGERRWPALVKIADAKHTRLSFTNLVELHVLSVLRGHRVRMDRIREATQFIQERIGSEHPLADVDAATDQVDIYIEYLGKLVNASRRQDVMRPMVERYLERIDRDERGLARRLFPATRHGEDLGPQRVVIDPAHHFGRPLLVGTGVPTAVVDSRFRAGESIDVLADDLGLQPSDVEEALRFESALRSAA